MDEKFRTVYEYIWVIFFFCCNEQVIFLTSHLKTITINSYTVCDFLISSDDDLTQKYEQFANTVAIKPLTIHIIYHKLD